MEDDLETGSRRLISSPALPKAVPSTLARAGCGQTTKAFHGLPLAHEIRHALQRLLDSGVETTIDLSRLPLGAVGETLLRELLGPGEVKAELSAIGRSSIRETGVSGVWWVEHYGTDGEPLGRFIEIASIPAILKAQPEDMREALTKLTEHLA